MRRLPLVFLVFHGLSGFFFFPGLAANSPSAPTVGTAPAGSAAPKLTPAEIGAERAGFTKEIRVQIAGHEQEPAETVFKDIVTLKGVPAGRLLAIMNAGYSQSLGVSCTHCHTANEWDRSDKPQKEITREMSRMVERINRELLPAIRHLDSEQPVVNCTTCHRGEVKPATTLGKKA
ncbi:MAG: c-type cytochrome [Opitutae bacterium]|nr:c-type cytochrome [Opitutae bacterium]